MHETNLYNKYVATVKLLNIYLAHFPKSEKYALVNIIRKSVYEIFGYIVEGRKKYYKKTTLTNLDISHEKLRMHLLLSFELGYFSYQDGRKGKDGNGSRRYIAISKLVDELGKMIGGWIKKIKAENQWK